MAHSPRPQPPPVSNHADGLVAAADDRISPYVALEKWTWLLIFIGGFALALGIATLREDAAIGWLIVVPSAVAIVVGIVLVYVRSRLKESR
ncbi:MAG: hypothetical protein ACRYGA_04055 [Janthinobacterium lividum]